MRGRAVGELLRRWRQERRLSQLELSARCDVSTRHLSCIETGRARPSSEMVLRLGEHLQIPLRERNEALLAAGHAPVYPERALEAAALAHVAAALRLVLDRHEPYPAVVLNRWWEVVDANAAVPALLDGVAPDLLEPPLNVLRLTLHSRGLAPRLLNLPRWRAHLLLQLDRRIAATGDDRLRSLRSEVRAYPAPAGEGPEPSEPSEHDTVLPMVLRVGESTVSMFSIAAALSTAGDVTLDELTVESFYPSDDASAGVLARLLPGATAAGTRR
ncbi:helix-turn-helix domain-containing protein [Vallicoccus soli]|uniref:helix-turn-helix domain-containing protein n=1 Tax=Vallicoccus soli TaxID=2339232 RepID=UPI001C499C76|nr:helix-turn-helix transcriptional regulator [Vallicoccus soli]